MSALLTYPVRKPQWILTYAGVNITGDISRMALAVVYTDRLGGAAGEIEIELEDHDKLWQGPWHPQEGDVTNLMLGYANEALLPCGDFQVDDLEKFARQSAAKGYPLSDGPHKTSGGSAIAFIDAPEGYEIELIQRGSDL